MALAPLQLHNTALATLFADDTPQWDDDTADFAWALLSSDYTPSDTHTTWGDVSANEISYDDYSQQAVTGRSVDNNTGEAQFDSDPADFGDPVSMQAKYLVLVVGTAGSLASADVVIGTVDLDDGGGSVTAANGEFKITPNANGWFRAGQA